MSLLDRIPSVCLGEEAINGLLSILSFSILGHVYIHFIGQNSTFSLSPETALPSAFGVNIFHRGHFNVGFLFVPFLVPNDRQRPAISSRCIPPPHLSTEQWATTSHIKSYPISELRVERLFLVNDAIYRRRRSRAPPHRIVNHFCPPPPHSI